MKTIYLAGGCFWGVVKYMSLLSAVVETRVGYANGNTEYPTYEDVCTGTTGHAETVCVVFNPEISNLDYILDQYYKIIDPISVNRQGADIGTQYRTGIYYVGEVDAPVIVDSVNRLSEDFRMPVAIEICPLMCFYMAEEYHQKYLEKNPEGYCHVDKEMFEEAKKN
ncbi:MAG: peptide-methionine (S)-S-oxide reductase MsrA [Defluviitaleaceae bacterium]|nr:peptide-methionine (S)-S-oxide reductase MsrA [Defluviitaleaceae bacterium]